MNDLREAAQQALEALEQSETTVPYEGFGMAHREAERKHRAAIVALRAALAEQPAEQVPVAWRCCPPGKCAYRQLHPTSNCPRENLPAAQPAKQPLTREQALAIVQSNPDTMTAIRMTELAHGIGEQE